MWSIIRTYFPTLDASTSNIYWTLQCEFMSMLWNFGNRSGELCVCKLIVSTYTGAYWCNHHTNNHRTCHQLPKAYSRVMSYMSFEIPSLLSAHVMSPRHVNHRLATTTLALMHRYRFDHHKPRIRWKSTSCAKGISFLTEHCLQLKRLGFTKGFHELPDSTESAISLDTYIWWDICDQPNVYIFCSAVQF